MVRIEFELRPPEVCRLTKMSGRLVLGFNALSDGAMELWQGGQRILHDYSAGWLGKALQGPDAHLLTFLDDLASVLAIQVRPTPVPNVLGPGSALDLLTRYDSLLAAEDEDLDDVPEELLSAGDFLVARSVYLPGDTRLLVLDRGERVELACEGVGAWASREDFLTELRSVAQRFFLEMRERSAQVNALEGHPGYVSPDELVRQGAQWQRRVEALLRRSTGEKFAPLAWPW
jgi:hypothetical protein